MTEEEFYKECMKVIINKKTPIWKLKYLFNLQLLKIENEKI